MTADYAERMQEFVLAIAQRERAWLEARLRELGPGDTWCHHEDRVLGTPDPAHPHTWTRTVTGHMLAPGMVCAALGNRVQYGPAPDPWPPTECIPTAGYHVTPHNGGGCFLR